MSWLRWLRGALGLGLVWAGAWLAAGLVVLLIVGFGAADVPFPLFWAFLGFLAGLTFSAVLRMVEGGRSLDRLSLGRFATWGGVGGLLLAGVLSAGLGWAAFPLLGGVFALAGAGCAAGSLALARRGHEGALVDAAPTSEADGLTQEEKRDLLGDA